MRSRATDAAAALVATIASVLGLTTLTTTSSWLGPAIWCCFVVVLAGVGLRRVTTHASLVLLGQLIVAAWIVLATAGSGSLRSGLPGPWTVDRIGALVADVVNVVTKYSAPIPATAGVTFLLVAAVAALALVVDFLGVTRSAPAAAGLPLLGAFLTAVANSGSSLAPGYFVVAALAWLFLVSRTASSSVRRWSTTLASPRTPTTAEDAEAGALSGLGSSARRLGVVALVAAVALPALLPHLPTRFVLDGLGRNDNAVGNGGRVGFNSTLDLTRSLQSGSLNVVLTYRTGAPGSPPPLRVVVASDYVGGQWRTAQVDNPTTRTFPTVSRISGEVATQERNVQVESNSLDAPHAASPQPVASADFGSSAWGSDPVTGDLYVRQRPDRYSLTYREVNVSGTQLRAGIPGGDDGRSDPTVSASLGLDAGSEAVVKDVSTQVVGSAADPYDKAVAIQDYLRGSDFTYSLTLPDNVTDAQGRQVTDPIDRFLTSKQGYCVQFASTMIMMARAQGIPARMAIGFLPGSLQDGLYTVRAADAHAWPELYFPGAGWLRFEPTPAARTGNAPAYTSISDPSANPTGPNRDPDATASPTASATNPADRKPDADASSAGAAAVPLGVRVRGWVTSPVNLVLLALLLGVLGSFVLPLTARAVHRRRRARAVDGQDLAEAEWSELVSRLGDLGLHPPSGGTLRDWRSHYAKEGYLDEDAQASMGRVVSTVERTRYARPGGAGVDLHQDVALIAKAASQSRPPRQRLQAFFLPQAGVRWWDRRIAAVLGAPGRWLRAVTERLSRRPR